MTPQQQNATIALDSFDFEPHVRRALETAVRMAGPDPVRAAHLLEAVLAEPPHSAAFKWLAELLPLSVTAPKKIKQKIKALTVDLPGDTGKVRSERRHCGG